MPVRSVGVDPLGLVLRRGLLAHLSVSRPSRGSEGGRDSLYLRLRLNDWIRTADVFDYVFEAEAVVREQREDGWYFREGIHMGDHLHPNAVGGQLLADAWDLDRLVGR